MNTENYRNFLRRAKALRDEGRNWKAVAELLNGEGYRTSGGREYCGSQVCNAVIQDDPSYRTNRPYKKKKRATKSVKHEPRALANKGNSSFEDTMTAVLCLDVDNETKKKIIGALL